MGRNALWHHHAVPRSTWSPCHDSIRIAPSLLAADFGRLADAVHGLEGSGAERLHIDVMDGVFVPNYTFGVDTVRVLRRETALPLELHLMIVEPERHLETFAAAGADGITVHYEASPHLHRTLTTIRAHESRGGVKNPSYRCLFPEPPPEGSIPACSEAGILGALPGILGSMMAMETISPCPNAMLMTIEIATTRTPSAAARVSKNNPAVTERIRGPKRRSISS